MENLPPVLDPQTPRPTVSLGARLFNVFATPGEVFEQLKGARVSTANWLAPALILIVVSWVGAWLVFSQDSIQQQLKEITDQAVEKQIAKQHLSDQQAEQARAVAAKFGSVGSRIGAYAAPVFLGLAVPFWWGLILWLVGTKALKADFSYMKGVEVAGLAGMISVLEAIVRALLILIMGNLFASPSLALLVKQFDPQNHVHGMLAVRQHHDFLGPGCADDRAGTVERGWFCQSGSVGLWRVDCPDRLADGLWLRHAGDFCALARTFEFAERVF